MDEFKVGDKVKFKNEENVGSNYSTNMPGHLIIHGSPSVIVGSEYRAKVVAISDQLIVVNYIGSDNGKQVQLGFRPEHLIKMSKNYKPRIITHIVVWEKVGCGDPSEIFYSEKEAKEKAKELYNDKDIVKTSIVIYKISEVTKLDVKVYFKKQ